MGDAIRVESLGKRYWLTHRPAPRYTALRDVLAEGIRGFGRRLAGGRREAAATREEFWALRDLSFGVAAGERLGVIGRNGAGKSTLLKILSRITEPDAGRAVIRGRLASLLEVGTGFHPELTGRENVYLNGAIMGMTRADIRRRFDRIVAFAEVESFLDTPVKHYSSGMYMRLAFAVAAHLEPEILLVDEVLAVGDQQFQNKCLGRMQEVSREGRTVLFVSHNMPAVASLCDRALLLHQGRLAQVGGAREVVDAYLAGIAGAAAAVRYDADRRPGSHGFQLLALQLTDAQGRPLPVADVEQPLALRIEYRTERPAMSLRIAVGFYLRGVCAFYSLEPQEQVRDLAGEYASTVTIPGNLLAEGEYSLRLSVFASRGGKVRLCEENDALAFRVHDPLSGASARGDYTGRLDGVVRPMLAWRSTYCGAGAPAAAREGGRENS